MKLQEIQSILEGMNMISVTVRILLATVIGGCIGSERGRHGRAAGLRTHILVCLGATMTTLMGLYVADVLKFPNDPLRMGSQVVSGIGFLGAGTIMVRRQSQVKGLTTAAGLWTTASIGLAIGVGFYGGAVLAFLVVMVTVSVLARLDRLTGAHEHGFYYVELEDLSCAKRFYAELNDVITEVDIMPAKSGIPEHVGLEFSVHDPKQYRSLLLQLEENEDIMIALPVHR